MEVTKVLSVRRFKCGYEVRREMWDHGDVDETEMCTAYTPSGDYIGDPKDAYRLVHERGIQPQPRKRKKTPSVCSIGYSVKDGKWYGWSHRAIYGFKVGSKVKKGNCGYRGKEWAAETTADAKKMAMDFAESVS